MVSIIRSPAISDQKRKLSTRRSRMAESHPVGVIPGEHPVTSVPLDAGPTEGGGTQEVNNLVEQARLSVLAQFKDEAESARELGRQRGLREGRLAGREEVKQSFAEEVARVRSVADKLQQAVESGVRGQEEMMVAIAFEAVCKVLGDIVVTREGVQALVRQATTHVLGAERLAVRLHPADLSILQDAGGLDGTLPSGMVVSWMGDKDIALGGCVVETDGGELDARLETQIEKLRSLLVAARRNVAVSE